MSPEKEIEVLFIKGAKKKLKAEEVNSFGMKQHPKRPSVIRWEPDYLLLSKPVNSD